METTSFVRELEIGAAGRAQAAQRPEA